MIVGVAAIVGLAGTSVGSVYAETAGHNAGHSKTLQTNLTQINDSGSTGTSTVTMNGREVTVKINVKGASPNLPHAQHFHIGGTNTCPGPEADTNNSGIINTAEGQPAYGEVRVSLTTSGAVDAGSALAVDRFPVSDAEGNLNYERTFTLPEGVTPEDVEKAVVVHHGIAKLFGDKTKYDGDPKSSLDDSLPLEATVPAGCGALTAMPTGAVNAGSGTLAENNQKALFALGATGVLGAGLVIATRGRMLAGRNQ